MAGAEGEDENENKRPAWAIPLGLASLAAIAGGVAFYVVKKRKSDNDSDEDLMV